MIEIIILLGVLSVLTVVVAVFYTKRIREAYEMYSKAKNAIDDIIISFNRQLQSQEKRMEVSNQKIGVLFNNNESFAEQLNTQKERITTLTENVESISTVEKSVPPIQVLEKKIAEIELAKDDLNKKVLEIQRQKLQQKETETKIESAIPIKREKALAPLTETELGVLEFLAVEGEKTAPEIKNKIMLSREHTARLMKKLYEKGYLERSANRIPFKYSLKEEMQRILRKPTQKS
ncbi:MAG: MarR family transcriptional regulator [Candidatus Bathyarchaeota archaeon]|nr:MAG: MarR family transcriptional regulator [Candidatus Bathyarchaeota archaeon]